MEEQYNKQHGAITRGDTVYAKDHRVQNKPTWAAGEVTRVLGKVMYDVRVGVDT